MFLFGNKIEKLTKFIVKALTKAIKAGNKIIALYEDSSDDILRLQVIIQQFEQIKTQLESNPAENTGEISAEEI